MSKRKITIILKIMLGILLFAILYFAYSIGKYDAKRTNTTEIIK